MRALLNFALFQLAWFACVLGAAAGNGWIGPLAVLLLVAVTLAGSRRRWHDGAFFAGIGLFGALLDSALLALGLTAYERPHGLLPAWTVPLWILALWVAFATLPGVSLAWLRGRPLAAALLGALGGPLSFLAGVRAGAVSLPAGELLGLGALAVQYSLVMLLLLGLAQSDLDATPSGSIAVS